ncbi:MAG: hypothetical protein MUC37_12870 [Hyphomicrobium sp.]|nr:hypothetical protein [Hyphomicrobium sp.]
MHDSRRTRQPLRVVAVGIIQPLVAGSGPYREVPGFADPTGRHVVVIDIVLLDENVLAIGGR